MAIVLFWLRVRSLCRVERAVAVVVDQIKPTQTHYRKGRLWKLPHFQLTRIQLLLKLNSTCTFRALANCARRPQTHTQTRSIHRRVRFHFPTRQWRQKKVEGERWANPTETEKQKETEEGPTERQTVRSFHRAGQPLTSVAELVMGARAWTRATERPNARDEKKTMVTQWMQAFSFARAYGATTRISPCVPPSCMHPTTNNRTGTVGSVKTLHAGLNFWTRMGYGKKRRRTLFQETKGLSRGVVSCGRWKTGKIGSKGWLALSCRVGREFRFAGLQLGRNKGANAVAVVTARV